MRPGASLLTAAFPRRASNVCRACSVAAHRLPGRGVPSAGLADLRDERSTQDAGNESSGLEHAAEVDAVLPTLAIEEVHEVLGREVAGRTRRVGAAAGSAGARVEAADAGLEPGHDVREGGPARVV